MFGVNSFKQAGDIAKGWANDLLGREQELHDLRMAVCKECVLYDPNSKRCNSKKCYNPETGEIRQFPGKGFICGCNCFMEKKSRVPSARCVLNKWPV